MVDSRISYRGAVSALARYGDPRVVGLAFLALIGLAVLVGVAIAVLGHLDLHHFGGLLIGAGPTAVASKREEIAAKRAQMATIFAEAGPDLDLTKVKAIEGDTTAKAAEIKRRNTELTELGVEFEALVEVENASKKDWTDGTSRQNPPLPGARNGSGEGDQRHDVKTLGDLFVESDAFLKYDRVTKKSPTVEINLEESFGRFIASHGVKAALDYGDAFAVKSPGDPMDTATGFAPQAVRIPTIITPGEQAPTVASLFPTGNTVQNAIPYMEETTTTNAAFEVDEGGTKPPSELAFEEKSSPVRKIATWLPVTDELFADAPAMRSYIENRLRTFVIQREDGQLLNGAGTGTPTELRGILHTVGIQTQAKAGDPTPDAIYKAITKIAVNAFLDATGLVIHHNDWQDIRLLRTADGIYIWGSPADPGPERIWGLPVVKTTRITENTALVGAYRDGAQIFRRSELAFAVSDQHAEYFVKNLLALRVEERLALVVFRPAAFCKVTGI